jgi:hypothetical protein
MHLVTIRLQPRRAKIVQFFRNVIFGATSAQFIMVKNTDILDTAALAPARYLRATGALIGAASAGGICSGGLISS